MKTALNIPDSVMAKLRAEPARRGVTVSELVEAALRRLQDESLVSPSRLPSHDGTAAGCWSTWPIATRCTHDGGAVKLGHRHEHSGLRSR